MLSGTPFELEDAAQGSVSVYRPPFEEFEVRCVRVEAGGSLTLGADEGPQLALVQAGTGMATATTSLSEEAVDAGLLAHVAIAKGKGGTGGQPCEPRRSLKAWSPGSLF